MTRILIYVRGSDFFQSVLAPSVLFGLAACALTAAQVASLDILQRKMLRQIVGWIWYKPEPWADTMRRMRSKVEDALRFFSIESWSVQLRRRQFRLACRVVKQLDGWPRRVVAWHPPATDSGAFRLRGRPATRWDDLLNEFAQQRLGQQSWHKAAANAWVSQEEAFVSFCVG